MPWHPEEPNSAGGDEDCAELSIYRDHWARELIYHVLLTATQCVSSWRLTQAARSLLMILEVTVEDYAAYNVCTDPSSQIQP